jgi:hypothetical protein
MIIAMKPISMLARRDPTIMSWKDLPPLKASWHGGLVINRVLDLSTISQFFECELLQYLLDQF